MLAARSSALTAVHRGFISGPSGGTKVQERCRGGRRPQLLERLLPCRDGGFERRRFDVQLLAVVDAEAEIPDHRMGPECDRDDVDTEDDLSILHRAVHDLSLEPHAIVERGQSTDLVAVGVGDREALTGRDSRDDHRAFSDLHRRAVDRDHEPFVGLHGQTWGRSASDGDAGSEQSADDHLKMAERGAHPDSLRCCAGPVTPPRPALPHSPDLLTDREHPDDSALGHVLRPAEQVAEQTLLKRRINAPARGDPDVLDAVHGEGNGRRGDAGVRAELPQHLAGARVEGAEVPVVRPAAEDEPAARREDRPPVHGVGEQMAPHPLVTVDVPGLDLAEVTRVLVDREADIRDIDPCPPLPGDVRLDLARHVAAVVVIGRDEQHAELRVVGRERPVLATPERGAEVGALARARHALRVVLGAAGLGIDALEDVLLHVGRRRYERDLVVAPFQPIEVAVARRMDEPFDGFPVLREVEDHRGIGLVPVPRVVPVILEVALDLPAVGVQGNGGGGVQVVAGALITEPRRGIARAPVREVRGRIVGASDPDRPATLLPGLPAPRLMTWLPGPGNRVGLPAGLAGLGVEGLHEAADAELSTRYAHHDLPFGDQWGQRHVVAGLPVLDLLLPRHLPGFGVEGHENAVVGGQIDLVAVKGDPAAGVVQHAETLGHLPLVSPQQLAAASLRRDDLIVGRGDEHDAVVDEKRGLMTGIDAGGQRPHRGQLLHVLRVDLIERTVRPALIVAASHQPVACFRLGEPLIGDRAISGDPLGIRQDGRQRGGHDCTEYHEVSDEFHRPPSFSGNSSLLTARGATLRYWVLPPTRPVNPAATTTLPSTALRGRVAKRRGAGPSTTRAPSVGSNREAWHEQKSVFESLCHIETGHPSCVQIAEYATTPAADWARVLSLSPVGSRRTTATWLSSDPSRITLATGSIG